VTLLGGCAGPAPEVDSAETGPATIEVLKQRIDVAPGLPGIVPVALAGGTEPPELPAVRLDDGRELESRLVWIGTRRDATTSTERWLDLPGPWTSHVGFFAEPPPGPGFWSLALDLPADAADQGVWIGEEGGAPRRLEVNWLPDEPYLAATTSPDVWEPPLGENVVSRPGLATFLERARDDPFLRWRARLLETGLGPREPAEGPRVTPDRFDDPYVEAVASTLEARWRAVTAFLASEDRALAAGVRRRLCLVADVGWGLWAPVWDQSPSEIDALLESLLAPAEPAAERRRAAYAWLEAQPPAVAWVIDDAGLDELGGERRVATIGLSNLTTRREVAWASPEGVQRIDDLVPVEPGTTVRLGVPVAADADPARVVARLGRWSAVLGASPALVPATPPGATIGRLALDWNARSWTSRRPEIEPARVGRTNALLQRAAGGGPADWSIYVEADWPSDVEVDEPGEDSVRIWLGPFGRPVAVIRVWADGRTTREASGGSTAVTASILREEDRWIAVVPIPPEAIEPGGLVRVGVERIRADGRRSAWPRPMHPWQSEPGRLGIDTTAWDEGR